MQTAINPEKYRKTVMSNRKIKRILTKEITIRID